MGVGFHTLEPPILIWGAPDCDVVPFLYHNDNEYPESGEPKGCLKRKSECGFGHMGQKSKKSKLTQTFLN